MKGRLGSWQRLFMGGRDEAVSGDPSTKTRNDRRDGGVSPPIQSGVGTSLGRKESPTHTVPDRPRFARLGDNQTQFLRYLFLLLAVGVILMSFNNKGVRDVDTGAAEDSTEAALPATTGSDDNYARSLERLVQDALMQMHGVNRVHVAVTLSGGPRKVLAENVTSERRTNEVPGNADQSTSFVIDERSSSQPVLVRSDQARQESPIVLVEFLPAIEGVVIVTDAAEDGRMRLEIGRAVATLLGVAAHRVYVLPQRFQ